MHVGFTGTRDGMSVQQKSALKFLLHSIKKAHGKHQPILHVGMDIGSDREASAMAKQSGFFVIGHPGTSSARTMDEDEVDKMYPSRDNLDRNRVIVSSSEFLIAAPKELKEVIRSGTWATVRNARKQMKPVFILDRGDSLARSRGRART